MRVDPGVGNKAAPVGTVPWAQAVRLTMQSIVHNLPKEPERLSGYVELCKEHRAWTLMNKPDGSVFKTFEEYCAHKEPWGLGKPYDELRPFLEAAVGKRRLELVTVAPAVKPSLPPGPGRGNKTEENHSDTVSDSFSHSLGDARKHERLRAIAERAPEPARELYRADLIGQKEAAKLGPKNPTPEEAAHVTKIAVTLAEVAKPLPKATKAERSKAKRVVTEKARELLGVLPKKAPVFDVEAALFELEPVHRGKVVFAVAAKFDWDTRRRLAAHVLGADPLPPRSIAEVENDIEALVLKADTDGRAKIAARVMAVLSAYSINVTVGDDQ